jgi:hypothetical protein
MVTKCVIMTVGVVNYLVRSPKKEMGWLSTNTNDGGQAAAGAAAAAAFQPLVLPIPPSP